MDPYPSCFYVHTITRDADGRIGLLAPERSVVANAEGAEQTGPGQTTQAPIQAVKR